MEQKISMKLNKMLVYNIQKIKIIANVFSNYNNMKLEMLQNENWKIYKYVEIKSMLLLNNNRSMKKK